MASPKRPHRWVFSPLLRDVVAEYETTSNRVRRKLTNAYDWCFCELCGEPTEFAISISEKARGVFKRGGNEVPMSQEICVKAEKFADGLATRYEQALAGIGPDNPYFMILQYCGANGIRTLRSEELRDREDRSADGHVSVEQFRLHVEGRARMAFWMQRGDFIGTAVGRNHVKSDQDGNQKLSRVGEPSKFYCERHNQHRSDNARRNYQRDRLFLERYQELIAQIWSEHASTLPSWDIEAHAHVRREAYRILQASKPRHTKSQAGMIAKLVAQGITNQSEIARQLGVSRQAVSAAIKRRAG